MHGEDEGNPGAQEKGRTSDRVMIVVLVLVAFGGIVVTLMSALISALA